MELYVWTVWGAKDDACHAKLAKLAIAKLISVFQTTRTNKML
jgi:hypothetical protein